MAMASVVERVGVAELEALATYVAAVADHHQIEAQAAGLLDHERDGHPRGTPYVTVRVPTVDAAEITAARLHEIGRLPAANWDHGWRIDGTVLAIDIYPDIEDSEIANHVNAAAAALSRRRRDLEDQVAQLLLRAPDVEVVGSGDDDDGRGYVDIYVASADGADRAERALATIDVVRPWRLERRGLSTRVYPLA